MRMQDTRPNASKHCKGSQKRNRAWTCRKRNIHMGDSRAADFVAKISFRGASDDHFKSACIQETGKGKDVPLSAPYSGFVGQQKNFDHVHGTFPTAARYIRRRILSTAGLCFS